MERMIEKAMAVSVREFIGDETDRMKIGCTIHTISGFIATHLGDGKHPRGLLFRLTLLGSILNLLYRYSKNNQASQYPLL